MKRLTLLSLLLLHGLCMFAGGDTLDSLRQVVMREYRQSCDTAGASQWACALDSSGRWGDIDYDDKDRASWALEKHLDRLIAIAPGHPQPALRALRHWFEGRYTNPNWWYGKIGVPRRILALAYLLDDCLPDDLRRLVAGTLRVIDSDDYPARPGGDRIQVLSNQAKALLWLRNPEGCKRLFALIEAEAQTAPIEETMYDAGGGIEVRNQHRPAGRGFQSDMTFHHRGDRVNSTMTYGIYPPEHYFYWQRLLRHTPWAFSRRHTDFMNRYVEECMRWHLVRDLCVEPSALNRELSRPTTALFQLPNYSGASRTPLIGARYFWQSGYFAFKRPLYETAVRMHSTRNANQEYAHNGEGTRNHFRGDGACHLSVTGREYLGVWRQYDFRHIPGVTAPAVPVDSMRADEVQTLCSATVFAGAVCDSLYGACAMDFVSERSDLRARKSWCFFDEGYVCLGSGISCTSPDTIFTTIEQCYASDRHHLVIDGSEVVRHTPLYLAAITHGVAPRDATYAYAVSPSIGRDASWFRILRCDKAVHAVRSTRTDLLYVTFFEPGTFQFDNCLLRVDRPCMLMLRDGEVRLSDPSHTLYKVNLTVQCPGMDFSREVRLPTWQFAGTTVLVD